MVYDNVKKHGQGRGGRNFSEAALEACPLSPLSSDPSSVKYSLVTVEKKDHDVYRRFGIRKADNYCQQQKAGNRRSLQEVSVSEVIWEMMFVEVEGKGRNAARDHYFLRGPKLLAISTGGSLTFVLGSEGVGVEMGGHVLLRASERAAKRFGGTVSLRNYVLQCIRSSGFETNKAEACAALASKKSLGRVVLFGCL